MLVLAPFAWVGVTFELQPQALALSPRFALFRRHLRMLCVNEIGIWMEQAIGSGDIEAGDARTRTKVDSGPFDEGSEKRQARGAGRTWCRGG